MNDETTLKEAKEFLREHVGAGAVCPVCRQFVKLYRRNITYAMTKSLILMAKNSQPGQYIHVLKLLTEMKHANSDWAKLRHWGLIEPLSAGRDDGSMRDGFWRLTDKGREFVANRLTIPASVTMYNRKALHFSDKFVTIKETIGTNFDYDAMMRG